MFFVLVLTMTLTIRKFFFVYSLFIQNASKENLKLFFIRLRFDKKSVNGQSKQRMKCVDCTSKK